MRRFDIPIEYYYNDKKHFYIPDFLIDETIYEIKSRAVLKNDNKGFLFEAKRNKMNEFINNSTIYKDFIILFDDELRADYFLDIRNYIFSWLLRDGFLKNVYGGKSLKMNLDYNDKNNYNNNKFRTAKELYLEWKNLSL